MSSTCGTRDGPMELAQECLPLTENSKHNNLIQKPEHEI